ncbi:integrator complex subunit 3 homolog isoform X1 [Aphis gossypii]|uniref:integrator complex subunit 3 homolog isoform X1 n=1 Tax=Aphis gossypii TaxID=80765 RepID=UPI002158B3DB|nr:integrator complex subunit 3 homolog isoform X1 [Aphis gossypii]
MAREESRGKRPFKIWDGFRNIRKSLLASSLKDLEIRGKEKLNIAPNESVRLVLETDGTQIEDPEYFKTLPNNTTVLLLRNDEYWYPAEVDAIKTAIAAIPKIVCETIHALELQDETPSWKIMDNKGRVTVVLHWDHRSQTYRGSSNSGGMDTSPSKKTMSHQQNGVGGSLLMENNNNNIGPLKREPNQVFQQQQQPVPNVYRHGSTPQITVIHHDAIPPSMHDGSSQPQHYQQHQPQGRRLSKQGSSSMDAAAIHVHTSECAQFIPPPPSHHHSAGGSGSSRSNSPSRGQLQAADHRMLPPPMMHQSSAAAADHHGFECDFHCCALHEEGRRIAVHNKSVATSPIQECHHAPPPPLPQQQPQPQPPSVGQPVSSSLSDGTRRASPKGHVRFLDAAGSPPMMPPPPLLPPSPPASPTRRQQPPSQPQPPLPPPLQHRSDSSDSETETTVIEDDSMTSEKFLLLIDQLVDKQDRHLTVKDIGIILERLNSKIVDVERLDRDYEATDCYNWTIKATIRGDVLQEYGIIYNGNYYGISEHPGYRQNDEELPNEDDEEALDDDDDAGADGTSAAPAGAAGGGGAGREDRAQHRRRADEEVNI